MRYNEVVKRILFMMLIISGNSISTGEVGNLSYCRDDVIAGILHQKHDIHTSRRLDKKQKYSERSGCRICGDDSLVCYMIDRSRPEWLGETTSVETPPEAEAPGNRLPTEYALEQSYPNPFNPAATIQFEVPSSGRVTIYIFDMMGRKIRNLVEKDFEPGYHSMIWDGKDDTGRQVASGMYFLMMTAGDFCQVKKGLLLR